MDFTAEEDNIDLSSLGVDDADINVVDNENGTASVTIVGEPQFDITIHYAGDVTFDPVMDGIITADVS